MTQFERDMKKSEAEISNRCARCNCALIIRVPESKTDTLFLIKDYISIEQTLPGTPPAWSKHNLYCIDCVNDYCTFGGDVNAL